MEDLDNVFEVWAKVIKNNPNVFGGNLTANSNPDPKFRIDIERLIDSLLYDENVDNKFKISDIVKVTIK